MCVDTHNITYLFSQLNHAEIIKYSASPFLQGKDCFICKKSGHRAKDCPEKSNWVSQNTKICLKCGGSGHEMFSCKNKYSPSDLKVGNLVHMCMM